MILALIYPEFAHLLTPVELLKATLYDYFVIWSILFTLYSYNNIQLTYDEFKTAEFGFSIFDMF